MVSKPIATCLWAGSLILMAAGTGLPAGDGSAGPPAEIRELQVQPGGLVFSRPGELRRILVTGISAGGERLDLTERARIESQGGIVELGPDSYLRAVREGQARVTVRSGGHSAEIAVRVDASSGSARTTFLRDVLPIMNKVGCSQGVCHGAAKGKNGFKLSLRGYDAEFDYRALLYDMSGRRFNRADPPQSLMLAKPTQQVAHGGGSVLQLGSPYYNSIMTWIEQEVPYGDPKADRVVGVEAHPGEIFMHAPGRRQQVAVVARYPDGSTRDVTREAHLGSSDVEAVAVEGSGVKGLRTGESTLMIRYEGQFVMVPVTVLNPEPGFVWAAMPQFNYIDKLVDRKLKRLRVQPSPLAEDAEFLRRVSLDLTGKIPEPERIRAFAQDPTDSQRKRSRAIDELIRSQAYADYWTLKWGDLLRSNRKFMSYKGMWTFREWLRQSIADNKPYDTLVRELLTSKGSTFENPAANFFLSARGPTAAMETTTQLFLGVRMVCAQCHDHPFEKWTQNQYFEMAAFFSAIGVRPGFESGEEVVYLKRVENELKHPKDGRVVNPRFLVTGGGVPSIPSLAEGDRRPALVEWLTSRENPFFARAIVNRVWSYFFHRGIISPVDDIRASNPPVNEALLAALAEDFEKHDFDLQHLMRTITNSRVYQTTFRTNQWNRHDDRNFSHQIPRRLGAEPLADAIALATGVRFELPEMPEDYSALQVPDPHVGKGGFLDLFGRPQREEPCECERRSDVSLPHALNLVNGPTLANAVSAPEGRIATLIQQGKSDRQLVEDLHLATLSRPPTSQEMQVGVDHLKHSESRAAGAQDLLWALLNSNGFLFNR